MIKKIKNIVSIFVIGIVLQSCGDEMGGVECISFDVEDFGENWDFSEVTTVDGVDDVVIYKYKGERFTGTVCFRRETKSGHFTKEDYFNWGQGSKSLGDIEDDIESGSFYVDTDNESIDAKESRISFVDGLKSGKEVGWAEYSPNRLDTAYVINWKNGYVDGKVIRYAYSVERDLFKEDTKEDTTKFFSVIANYKKGEMHGKVSHYALSTENYKETPTVFNQINFVHRYCEYVNGSLNGALKFYETATDGDKRVVYLKSDNKYYKGNEIASKKYYSDGEISLAYSKSISVIWYPVKTYPDTIVDGKKYRFSFNDYNRWEMQQQGCRSGLSDTWTQTIKNGVRVCEQDSNINLKLPILEGWGDLVFIDKK